jgi:hypothetical protein
MSRTVRTELSGSSGPLARLVFGKKMRNRSTDAEFGGRNTEFLGQPEDGKWEPTFSTFLIGNL